MKRYVLLILLLAGIQRVNGQEFLDRDSLVSEFKTFINILETTHPDPYSGFGGKVFFHEQANEVKKSLWNTPHTLREYRSRLMSFISNIQDSHTGIYEIESSQEQERYIPISFKCIADGLIVTEISSEYKELIGSKLLGINNKSTDELLQFTAAGYACENIYDRYYRLNAHIAKASFLKKLYPDADNSVSVRLLAPDGMEMILELPFSDYSDSKKAETDKIPCAGYIPRINLQYTFLDKEKQTMYFKLATVSARENFEYMYEHGWDFYPQLEYLYNNFLHKDVPTDTLAAIAELPSFSNTFSDMLKEMKRSSSRNLIIDLRGNGGGWTPITLPSLFYMFGDNYLLKDLQTKFVRLISPLYLKKINRSMEEYNKSNHSNLSLGDYVADMEDKDSISIEERRNGFIGSCMSSSKYELESLNGKPLYTPEKIYVITDNTTFSAAFHYAFYLWKMGATVVGVPCRQAPNTYMELTPFQLPYTRLNGSISNSIQIFFPGNDRRAKIFYPDICLSYDDYKKYNFDRQAEVLFLLDYIKQIK